MSFAKRLAEHPLPPRLSVLSIQSHVVHGTVGNKAATFPMQLFGIDVDPLHVVRFSNHTGYKVFKGSRMTPEEFVDVVEGLRVNNILDSYSHILTGYVGNAAVLAEIAKVVVEAKRLNPEVKYLCDPVCGDNGKMYVPAETAEVYRSTILPLADIVTPNGFEASLISGIEITSVDAAVECAEWYHARGVSMVVIKSFELADVPATIHLLGSWVTNGGDVVDGATRERFLIKIPKKNYEFTGTGDCFSALVLAQLVTGKRDFRAILEHAVAAMQNVLDVTESYDLDVTGRKELAVVQSREFILQPLFTCDTTCLPP